MSEAIVFAERAIAPGGDAIWPLALEHLVAPLRLDPRAGRRRRARARVRRRRRSRPGRATEVSSWRLELARFYDDHARVHLRRDPGTAALLAALRADGVRLAAYGQGPREASAATLGFLGLDRRLDAVVLEPAGDGYAACLDGPRRLRRAATSARARSSRELRQ